MARPRVLLVEQDPTTRLAATAALAPLYEVVAPAEGDDPVRLARASNPALALVGASSRSAEAMRIARALRTDLRPIARVALLDPQARASVQRDALPHERVDGYYGVSLEPERLRAFVADVLAGKSPFLDGPRGRGVLSRLFTRVRGGTLG
jgi:DNA-binding NarL/FixJ family response regulator